MVLLQRHHVEENCWYLDGRWWVMYRRYSVCIMIVQLVAIFVESRRVHRNK